MAKVPKLRFPGFTDAWEQDKFAKVLKTHQFRDYLAEPTEKGKYKIIQQGDKPVVGYANGKPFKDFHKVILFGDHTVSLYNPLQPFFVATDGVKILSADGFDGDYLFVTLECYKPKPQGYKRHFTILKSRDVWYTSNKDEQEAIGTFFRQLDDLLSLHRRKLEAVANLKKSLLQKMFPKNGEVVPEVRFPGFTDAWEQRKLGEVADFSKGNGYSKNDLIQDGSPVILYGRLYTQYEIVITEIDTFVERQEKSVLSKGGEVIVPASGETSENIARASVVENKGIILGGDLNIINVNKTIDPVFLVLAISNGSQQKELSKRAQGKSIVHIRNSDLQQVGLLYPTMDEQSAIGTFFRQLDDLLSLHRRKLEHLKSLKKALLQQMFV
ncbi:restriction endonuclease subunit S [Streptococcus macacae]|uniref:Type I restriction modification DNA specificity domain protein n=1 Tax=Streptococcus macacae NCTC 11558 TaxID=764298 RepID=G5JXC0_9STRE|nr:restriction endonuclease subunit S [Streptococcus macacae]EHJ53280.1 type I restriction modification DNA specificity domain protein [Streptococcus macacae NCTC 11558]SUN79160.1 type-I specificity determinant subunit [Streptococcus macacae NCTC 11558]